MQAPHSEDSLLTTLDVLPRIHVALLAGGRTPLRGLRMVNRSHQALEDLCLEVTSEPPLLRPATIPLGTLDAGSEVDLGAARLATLVPMDTACLQRLTERAAGWVRARVLDGEGRELARAEAPWTLLPIDVWPGMGVAPEHLAAFVLPNDPAVVGVLQRAAHHLVQSTGSPALDGYQSPGRAAQLVAAIYDALRDAELTYINPPASFEADGQRMRLPSEVMATRLATCLDVALLAAAALEQAGLHPLVILVEGHAIAGAWLIEETFSTASVEDPVRLAKRIELPELVVFDPTLVTARPSPDFAGARAAAEARLADRDAFRVAVDVRRARLGGVLPLPTLAGRATEPGGAPIPQSSADSERPKRDVEQELRDYLAARARAAGAVESPATRLERWLRQLLDLTMRNRLLNAAGRSKRVIPLLAPDLGALEDRFAEGAALRIEPRPPELDADQDEGVGEARITPLLESALAARALHATLAAEELGQRLLELFRAARTAQEEGGANRLYLALGFLTYREHGRAGALRRAPILLLPVELRRASVRRRYTLALGGDEPRVNVTLLEYLRRDHQIDVAGLEPLPMDDTGVDVALVLRLFKEAVKDETDWEVRHECELGLFSFAKYLLWCDLRERLATLRENALVAHLVDHPREAFVQAATAPSVEALDSCFGAAEVLAPLSYDSSQLAAILAAADGMTFVLEGPPGTGKSQTIANLIAHAIAAGKSVLFVSEKMAALEVVHRRLQALGLGPACLELHSNKSNKKAALAQFGAALAEGRVRGARRRPWDEIAADSDAQRARLNGHVDALHAPRASGESIAAVLGRVLAVAAVACTEDAPAGHAREDEAGPYTLADFGLGDPLEITAETLRAWRSHLDELDVEALAQGVRADHPLLEVGRTDYSPLIEQSTRATLRDFDAPATQFDVTARALGATVGLTTADAYDSQHLPKTRAGWDALDALAATLGAAPPAGAALAACLVDDAELARIQADVLEAQELARLEAGLAARFRASPLTLDVAALDATRRAMDGGGWFTRWRKGRALRAALRGIALAPRALSLDAAVAALDDAQRVAVLAPRVDASSAAVAALLGDEWQGARTEFARANSALQRIDGLRAAVAEYAREVDVARAELGPRLAARAHAGASVDAPLAAFRASREALGAALAGLRAAAEPHDGAPDGASLDALATLQAAARRWVAHWSALRGWTAYQRARTTAVAGGLDPAIRALESGAAPAGAARATFEAFFARTFALHAISADERLKAFDGRAHERALRRFVELDDERMFAAREEVRQRAGARRPGRGAVATPSQGSALGVLQRELTKKTRHLALRRLLSELGPLAQELKPCFLMSPMSVAQYLAPDCPPFDIVVFDEASQIPVWDAIGAIARGAQAVIVGDPKQLPPTSFFDRTGDDETEEDELQDLESILDECLAAQVPAQRLTWHYRSRDESLIAFSNRRYYDAQLRTFPASRGAGVGLALRFVAEGVYDKGRTRTNPTEARAVVDEVVRRLQDPTQRARSIGVVTFSQAQQSLVMDLLDEAQRRHPELEAAFADSNPEPVFVKNLENVQGDERDVIVFSIGYGPDAGGRVAMNFGPLNKDGGERRLNVAITRARVELSVFTSLRSEQIDLARTNARGVHDLRAFLRFAEDSSNGSGAGTTATSDADTPRRACARDDGALVAAIAERLTARGWRVVTDVGRSEVRVDLAVRHPERSDEFLLGIATDGASYAGFATARDRDRLQGDVLRGLGWRLERVWAIDWWRDAGAELARLEAALRAALAEEPRAEDSADLERPEHSEH